jgi:hypothetical protein
MSFSPTGKIASSRKKIRGENDGTAHGATSVLCFDKLCEVQKCELGYSQKPKLVFGLSVEE